MVSLHVNLMSFPSNELLKFSLGTWTESYALANTVIAQMTLDEKLRVIIGTGQLNAARKLHIHLYIGFSTYEEAMQVDVWETQPRSRDSEFPPYAFKMVQQECG
jgi:hypothetical protein